MNLSVVKKYLFLLLVSFNFTSKTNGLNVRNNRAKKNIDVLREVFNILKSDGKSSGFDKNVYTKINSKWIEDLKERDRRGKRKLLVKRLVPHNHKSDVYEYDNAYKTLYRPLIRLDRKNKQVRFLANDNEIGNKLNNFIKQSDDFDTIERPKRDLFVPVDNYLLRPFKAYYRDEEEDKINKDIKNYVRGKNRLKVLRLKNSILRNIESIPMSRDRTAKYKVLDKTNNKTFDFFIKTVTSPEHQHNDIFPQYHYWNYWTYDKEILQDNCKGIAVQFGNICIQPPPH